MTKLKLRGYASFVSETHIENFWVEGYPATPSRYRTWSPSETGNEKGGIKKGRGALHPGPYVTEGLRTMTSARSGWLGGKSLPPESMRLSPDPHWWPRQISSA